MIVFVNNKSVELERQENISGMLQLINIPGPNGIAVAVNNAVIPKAEWGNYSIKENDRLTVIRATQGG